MRVLIVGSGGREHALAWKIAQSPKVTAMFFTPGNAGMAAFGECANIDPTDIKRLLEYAKVKKIDIAIIGPEAPLIKGIANIFNQEGIRTFGPINMAAILEGSKAFARIFNENNNIPHPEFRIFMHSEEAVAYAKKCYGGSDPFNVVVKVDGQALGKGVFVCDCLDDALSAIHRIMIDREFGHAGDNIVIEKRLSGLEASIIVITDGISVFPLIPVQDYKRAKDGDTGEMTGGMGGYAPVPHITPKIYQQVLDTIIHPTLKGLADEGVPYCGVLYAGIMLTDSGPVLLEYNCRFGDPETQVCMPLLQNDLAEIIEATLDGTLNAIEPKWSKKRAVSVVLTSGGYPDKYEKEKIISGLYTAERTKDVTIFHAGTAFRNGDTITSGGRVLAVTATAAKYQTAIERAYDTARKISFDGMDYRTDIGFKAIS